jgi:hypothetical protein
MSFLRRRGANAASTVAPPPASNDGLTAKRGSEPLRDYDTLDAKQIAAALTHADVETLSLVREYELKFRRRDGVLDELARLRQAGRPSGRA